MAETILTPIFEPEFLGFSYGFRPGRGAHDALDALAYGIERRKINWIADADIRAFFDQLDRGWLIEFVEHRIGDRRVIRLISRWLGAGVMEEGEWRDTLRGVPQCSSVSPILWERSHKTGRSNAALLVIPAELSCISCVQDG